MDRIAEIEYLLGQERNKDVGLKQSHNGKRGVETHHRGTAHSQRTHTLVNFERQWTGRY